MTQSSELTQKSWLLARLNETLQDSLNLLQKLSELDVGASVVGVVPQGNLLEQCLAICEQQRQHPPEAIRTLHHFACTGGTLISKCIAALPNVQLLSEVDPLSQILLNGDKPVFAPTDIITLLRQSTRKTKDQVIVEIFRNDISVVYREALQTGKRLVIRDHAHSHFCLGHDVPIRPTCLALLPPDIPSLSILTVRHPLDSYLSLINNDWQHFEPKTIDEYSRRYLLFLESYPGVHTERYEEFVRCPTESMQRICSKLNLIYNSDFIDHFPALKITGDSGRSGEIIEARPSRTIDKLIQDEAARSQAYQELVALLGYSIFP